MKVSKEIYPKKFQPNENLGISLTGSPETISPRSSSSDDHILMTPNENEEPKKDGIL